jgi:hypothetical protein
MFSYLAQFGLSNFISSSKLYLHRLLFLGHKSCGELSSQRRVIGSLLFLSAPTFHCRTAGPGESKSCRSLTLFDIPCEMTTDGFVGHRSTYLQLGFFPLFPNPRRFRCHKSSQVHKFVDDFEICVTKSHSSSGIDNRPNFSHNHVFCLLLFDLHPYFCCFC